MYLQCASVHVKGVRETLEKKHMCLPIMLRNYESDKPDTKEMAAEKLGGRDTDGEIGMCTKAKEGSRALLTLSLYKALTLLCSGNLTWSFSTVLPLSYILALFHTSFIDLR